jgi:ribosomal protein S4
MAIKKVRRLTLFNKKNRFKPLYKQFIKLRENVQNRKKPLRFKKEKWKQFIFFGKKKLKIYNKCKTRDQFRYQVNAKQNKWNSYERRYNAILQFYKKFKLFFGNFNKKKIKKFINKTKNDNLNRGLILLKQLENRLDIVLYRAKFARSIRGSRQLIIHGKILINNKKIKSQSYILNSGDLISINKDKKTRKMIEINIANSNLWPIPPKTLMINYKTFQIIFKSIDKNTNLGLYYNFHLKLDKLILDFK